MTVRWVVVELAEVLADVLAEPAGALQAVRTTPATVASNSLVPDDTSTQTTGPVVARQVTFRVPR